MKFFCTNVSKFIYDIELQKYMVPLLIGSGDIFAFTLKMNRTNDKWVWLQWGAPVSLVLRSIHLDVASSVRAELITHISIQCLCSLPETSAY